MSVRVDIRDSEVLTMIGREIRLVQNVSENLLPIFAFDIIATAKSNLQNNASVYSGELNASLGILQQDSESILVGTTKPYAGIVERGRGAIRAGAGKILHFFLKDGTEIFAKSVGPARPRPFFEPAVIEALKRFKRTLKEYLEGQ